MARILRRVANAWRLAGVIAGTAAVAIQADEVWIRSSEPGGAPHRVEGTIEDYTGLSLRLTTSQGTTRQFASDRVLRVETDWPDGYRASLTASEKGDIEQAYQHLVPAVAAEDRAWVQRTVLHRMVKLLVRLQRTATACDAYLTIVEQDPESPVVEDMPLAWSPSEAVDAGRARRWLAGGAGSHARLLAASHLLTSEQKPQAVSLLQALSGDSDERIAALAAAQLWRTQHTTATRSHAEKWEDHVRRRIPPPLASGPYLILGQLWQRLGESDRAVLALMRVPIHGTDDAGRGARALLSAARILQRGEHATEAAELLAEIVRRYPQAAERLEAEHLLQQGD